MAKGDLPRAAQAAARVVEAIGDLRGELEVLAEVADSDALESAVGVAKEKVAAAVSDATRAGGQAFLGTLLGALAEAAVAAGEDAE